MQRTFSIKTLGCKLNQYESSLIAGQFLGHGWISRPFGEKVDIVIINTCTVTNKSDKKCRNYIRQGAVFSKTGKVLVTGCLAERDAENVNKMPEVLAVVMNSDKEMISSIVNKQYDTLMHQGDGMAGSYLNKIVSEKTAGFPLPFYRTRGLLKIQDGCDGKCSYCIVPSVRGLPVSRNFNEILDHARRLSDADCPELILTGITIGKYNSDNKSLSDLVNAIININGNFRVRITSIEPNHITDDLIGSFSSPRVCQHIHIPLQSGSDRILNLMRRPYSVRDYFNVIERIRKEHNDISIGTDVILGFPGETEEDFRSTLKAVEEVKFSYVHQFTFSPRSGTDASQMAGCPTEEISGRSLRLRELSAVNGYNYRKKFIGKSLPSVIEKNKTRSGYRAVSSNYIKIDIKNSLINNDMIGKITEVVLESVEMDRATGVL
jgi:threonylcarbamoyladenosine tRNA methylthiotransferase MtaB